MNSLDKSSYLSVEIIGHKTLIPTSSVAEVIRNSTVRSLPGLKPGFVGVTGLRGDVLALVDISARPKSESSYVILNLDGQRAAIAVDSVVGIINETLDNSSTERKHMFLISYSDWQLLDVEAIEKALA